MNRYDARQQFIEAYRLLKAILETRDGVSGSYAGAALALQQRLGDRQSERAA